MSTFVSNESAKVIPLFGDRLNLSEEIELLTEEEMLTDEMESTLEAGELLHPSLPERVSVSHRPDQAVYKLRAQLAHLKETMNRINYYLSDIDDSLPPRP